MKLAEALILRADHQKRMAQLKQRIVALPAMLHFRGDKLFDVAIQEIHLLESG